MCTTRSFDFFRISTILVIFISRPLKTIWLIFSLFSCVTVSIGGLDNTHRDIYWFQHHSFLSSFFNIPKVTSLKMSYLSNQLSNSCETYTKVFWRLVPTVRHNNTNFSTCLVDATLYHMKVDFEPSHLKTTTTIIYSLTLVYLFISILPLEILLANIFPYNIRLLISINFQSFRMF